MYIIDFYIFSNIFYIYSIYISKDPHPVHLNLKFTKICTVPQSTSDQIIPSDVHSRHALVCFHAHTGRAGPQPRDASLHEPGPDTQAQVVNDYHSQKL